MNVRLFFRPMLMSVFSVFWHRCPLPQKIWGVPLLSMLVILVADSLSAAVLAPISATGWEEDVILATSEAHGSGTTAQMDGPTGSDGATVFYQQGRNGSSPSTGLPTGLAESENTSGLFFQLQSFTANNAIWHGGTLTLSSAAYYRSIALIGATGNGAADLTITLSYATGGDDVFSNIGADGVNHDWFNGGDIAYTANGRVSTESGVYEYVNTGNPRLYETILTADHTRLLESVTITDNAVGTQNSAIMALSGEQFAVPEPSSSAMMAMALLVLFGLRRIVGR